MFPPRKFDFLGAYAFTSIPAIHAIARRGIAAHSMDLRGKMLFSGACKPDPVDALLQGREKMMPTIGQNLSSLQNR